MNQIHYRLGLLFGKRYRIWYWRTHQTGDGYGNWMWGVRKGLSEIPQTGDQKP